MFWAWLDQFLADSPFGGTFASEIVWVDNSTVRDEAMVALGVTATRIRANYIATDEAADQVASMVDLRASVASAGVGDAFPYMFMYLYYEQYAIIFVEAMQNLGLALLAVLIIVYLLVANFGLTLLVMLCVLMVDVNILGLMWLWLSTMKDLLLTGDRVHSIRGCLSGTMAYVLRCHAPGRKTFCDALREAIANGYTETDVREDLSD